MNLFLCSAVYDDTELISFFHAIMNVMLCHYVVF